MSSFTDLLDLASVRLGAAVVATNDDFFAEKENLLRPGPAVWKEHEYTDRGKWMDGWESRRKRIAEDDPDPHDWAIIRLGVPGIIRGVVVDTAFFRGNYPDACSIQATGAPIDARLETLLGPSTVWTELLPVSKLKGDSKNLFETSSPYAFTHVRLKMHPDGGIARLRVHGEVVPPFSRIGHARGEIDLAYVEHGGDVLLASDMFFGERRNLVMPGRAPNMSDGWETRRRRGPGSDWAILRLGAVGTITRVEIDTKHFIGNFPDTCRLQACNRRDATADELALPDAPWRDLLPRTKLQAHTRHFFEAELAELGPASHVRLEVFPDGGVSRLRVHGVIDEEERKRLGLRRLATLPPDLLAAELRACCASSRWVDSMTSQRPFSSPAAVLDAAERAWAKTVPDDWREAFLAHPRIGEREAKVDRPSHEKTWSSKEQAGMSSATEEVRAAISAANRTYEERFGFVYIVCASGKTGAELLAILEGRLTNTVDAELARAAEEIAKITRLRLEKLLEP